MHVPWGPLLVFRTFLFRIYAGREWTWTYITHCILYYLLDCWYCLLLLAVAHIKCGFLSLAQLLVRLPWISWGNYFLTLYCLDACGKGFIFCRRVHYKCLLLYPLPLWSSLVLVWSTVYISLMFFLYYLIPFTTNSSAWVHCPHTFSVDVELDNFFLHLEFFSSFFPSLVGIVGLCFILKRGFVSWSFYRDTLMSTPFL